MSHRHKRSRPPFRHVVQFFSGRAQRTAAIVEYVREGLAAGEACVVAATPAVIDAVRADLADVGRELPAGRLRFLNAAEVAASLFSNPARAAERFELTLAPVIRAAAEAAPAGRARVYGEMMDVLRRAGRRDHALALERLWPALAEKTPFTLLCGYGYETIEQDDCAWDFVEPHDVALPSSEPSARELQLARGVENALQERMWMLRAVVASEPKLALLPFGTAAMLWLKRSMPRAAARAAGALASVAAALPTSDLF